MRDIPEIVFHERVGKRTDGRWAVRCGADITGKRLGMLQSTRDPGRVSCKRCLRLMALNRGRRLR